MPWYDLGLEDAVLAPFTLPVKGIGALATGAVRGGKQAAKDSGGDFGATAGGAVKGGVNEVGGVAQQIPGVGPLLGALGDIGGLFGPTDTSFLSPYQVDPAVRDTAMSISNSRVPIRQADPTQINQQQIAFQRGQAADARQAQMGALGLAQQAALGNVPSAAEIQSRQAIEQATADQFALAGSAGGGISEQVAAQRQAQNQAGQLARQGAADAARLRADEMAAARGQLLGGTGQLRGQDLGALGFEGGIAQAQAGLNQGTALANLGAQQGADALDLQRQNIALQGLLGADTLGFNAFTAPQHDQALIVSGDRDRQAKLFGGILGAGAGILGLGV